MLSCRMKVREEPIPHCKTEDFELLLPSVQN